LPYPRGRHHGTHTVDAPEHHSAETALEATALEQQAGYYIPSGRYWDHIDRFDPDVIAQIDATWLRAFEIG
jgi:hypothetical protein